jgi:acid phosphatase family membrane protein YuiD
MLYFLSPFIAWLVAGTTKFIVNYFRFGKNAFGRIGNGGFPSTHTTVITTPTVLIGINEGLFSPLLGLGVAIILIVIIDATGLRYHVGKHATMINLLIEETALSKEKKMQLRESMGHTKFEVLGGLILGIVLGFVLDFIFSYLNLYL